jgi:hypothetical protein
MSHPLYDPITLTVEREFDKISLTQPHGTVYEFLFLVKKMALAMGYHPDNWDEAILEAADEIQQDQLLRERDEPSA